MDDLAPAKRSSPPPELHARLLAQRQQARRKRHDADTHGRREGFLQARLDRLAARKQRADAVRARSRESESASAVAAKLATLRESLSAAQAARSAIYSHIAAQGSREVARAQRIARQHKERLRRENEASRLALQDKLEQAERRRERALQDRVVRRRSPSPEPILVEEQESVPSPDEAAERIQRWWAGLRARMRARKFKALHLTHEWAPEVPFEVLTDVVRSTRTIDCTVKLLAVAGLIAPGESVSSQQATCRIFLTTLLLVGHPKEVLARSGPLDQRLVEQAKSVASRFESWLNAVLVGRQISSASFITAFEDFRTTFESWKVEDSAALVEVMLAQFVELDLIWQIVKNDTDPTVARDYHAGIKENQVLLLARIRRIAGDDTRKLVRQAVLKARRRRLPTKARSPPSQQDLQQQPGAHEAIRPAAGPGVVSALNLGGRHTMPSNRQLVHELALDPDWEIPSVGATEEEQEMKRVFFRSLTEEMRMGRWAVWVPIIVQECKVRLLRMVKPNSPTFKAITTTFDIPFIEQQCRSQSFDLDNFTKTVTDMMRALCAPYRDEAVANVAKMDGGIFRDEMDQCELFAMRLEGILIMLDIMLLDSANYHLRTAAPQLAREAVAYERKLFAADLERKVTDLSRTRAWLGQTASQMLTGNASRDVESVNHPADRHIEPRKLLARAIATLIVSPAAAIDASALPETLHLDAAHIAALRKAADVVVLVASTMTTARAVMRPKQQYLSPLTWSTLAERLLVLAMADGEERIIYSTGADSNTIVPASVFDRATIAPEVNAHIDSNLAQEHEPREARQKRHAALGNLLHRTGTDGDAVAKVLRRRLIDLLQRGILSATEHGHGHGNGSGNAGAASGISGAAAPRMSTGLRSINNISSSALSSGGSQGGAQAQASAHAHSDAQASLGRSLSAAGFDDVKTTAADFLTRATNVAVVNALTFAPWYDELLASAVADAAAAAAAGADAAANAAQTE